MNESVVIALIAVIPSMLTAMTTVITTLITNRKKKQKEMKDGLNDINKRISDKIDDKIDELKGNLEGKIDKVSKDFGDYQKTSSANMKVLLRHNIDQMYDKFTSRGYITFKDLEELEETYQSYSSLGGNHIGEEKYKAIKELPVIDK